MISSRQENKTAHDQVVFSSILSDLTSALPGRSLAAAEIASATAALLDPSIPDETKGTFLGAWAQRGESAEELAAAAEAFLPQAVDPGLRGSWNGKALLDCCGTGGGGLNLINISTGLMFILGAMGIPVVKHGNRGMTKKSGSADVLEALGIRIDPPPAQVPRCLEEVGCAFLFAPTYHTTFAVIAPVRRQLAAQGQRTIFNLLGPLLNPARPDARLVGVFKLEHVNLYRQALATMGCPRYLVACGEDSGSGKMIGEVSAQGKTTVAGPLSCDILDLKTESSSPEKLETLFVQNAQESAKRLIALLSGEEKGLGLNTLLINAAVAASIHGTASSIEEGHELSKEAIDSGKARALLKRWQEFSQRM
jgi:anthranilate phosphoribosyltransferase